MVFAPCGAHVTDPVHAAEPLVSAFQVSFVLLLSFVKSVEYSTDATPVPPVPSAAVTLTPICCVLYHVLVTLFFVIEVPVVVMLLFEIDGAFVSTVTVRVNEYVLFAA